MSRSWSLAVLLLFAACGGKDELCRFGVQNGVSTKCQELGEAGAPPDVAPLGKTCDGVGAAKCGPSEFCEHPAGQCKPDTSGTCAPRPTVCTQVFAQVCGCDGNTYANDCERQGKGVAKDHDGPCKK